MLSRTADHLYWMARYMERAENTARMLHAGYQTSLLPRQAVAAEHNWQGQLSISELLPAYTTRHGPVVPERVLDFMVCDAANPSSILACLCAARENARAVRGTLSTEAWEVQNQTWLEARRLLRGNAFERDPAQLFEWVIFRSHLSRGVTVGTMLQDEAQQFMRLGTFLERADNTARLLGAKFHAAPLAPALGSAALEHDLYHWSTLLASVSGLETYRKVYRDTVTPERVAELLILRPDMPRSLHASMRQVQANLELLARESQGPQGQPSETRRRTGELLARLRFTRIDEILDSGLHAFITGFLGRINDLGARITRDFLAPA